VLRLAPAAAQRLKAWCPTTPVPVKHDGEAGDHVLLEVVFESEAHARFMVLGLGSRAQVVKPEALRQWVQSEAAVISQG
jgi:hypothetical protein